MKNKKRDAPIRLSGLFMLHGALSFLGALHLTCGLEGPGDDAPEEGDSLERDCARGKSEEEWIRWCHGDSFLCVEVKWLLLFYCRSDIWWRKEIVKMVFGKIKALREVS